MKKFLLILLFPVIGLAQNKSVQASRTWIKKEGPAILSTYAQLLALAVVDAGGGRYNHFLNGSVEGQAVVGGVVKAFELSPT